MRLISQLNTEISRVLQKLLKYFNSTATLTSYVLWSAGFFPVMLILNLNDLEFTIFFTKLFKPRKDEQNDKNVITFARTYNPNHQFSFNKFKNCIKNTTNKYLQKAFNNKKYSLLHHNQRN